MSGEEDPLRIQLGNLTGLLAKIQPAVAAAGCKDAKDEACVDRVAEANVRHALAEVRRQRPYIAERADAGTIALVGALYDVGSGRVTFLERAVPAPKP
jgi:carbonic anhydrase